MSKSKRNKAGRKKSSDRRVRNAAPRSAVAALDAARPNSDVARTFFAATRETTFQALNPFDRESVRTQARHEFLNNPHAAGIARLFGSYVVGSGPRLTFVGFEKTTRRTISKDVREDVESRFRRFAVETRLAPLLRQATQNLVVDGEAFLCLTPRPQASAGFGVALLDSQRIGNPRGERSTPKTQDGVYLDEFDEPSAYCVYDVPEYSTTFYDASRFQLFSASNVVHVFRAELPGQTRGFSWFAPVLRLLQQLREYTEAVIEAAKSSAKCFATIETQNGFENCEDYVNVDPNNDYYSNQTFETPNGKILTLTPGTTMKGFAPTQPTTNCSEFVAQLLSQIGYALGFPRNKSTGSSHEYNFASGRLDNQPFELLIDELQRDLFENYCVDKIFETFYRAILPDLLRLFPFDEVPTFEDVEWSWVWPKPPLIDAESTARTNAIRVKSLQATVAEVWRETHPSVDFDDVRAEFQRDRSDFPELFGAALDAEPSPNEGITTRTQIEEPTAPTAAATAQL